MEEVFVGGGWLVSKFDSFLNAWTCTGRSGRWVVMTPNLKKQNIKNFAKSAKNQPG